MTTYDNNFKVKNGLDVATTATVGNDVVATGSVTAGNSISLVSSQNAQSLIKVLNNSKGASAQAQVSVIAQDTGGGYHGGFLKTFPNNQSGGTNNGITPASVPYTLLGNISSSTNYFRIGSGGHAIGLYSGSTSSVPDIYISTSSQVIVNQPTSFGATAGITVNQINYSDSTVQSTAWNSSASVAWSQITGAPSVTGYTGSQGAMGYTGSQGSQGTMGLQGYTGSKGDQGNAGYTGSFGYTGSQGTQGSAGYTGSQGTQGTQGYTGSHGDLGYTGSTGSTGYTGSKGDQGTPGNSDKYQTTSNSSYTIGAVNSTADITIPTGLSWTVGQNAVIAHDVSNLVYVTVNSYNSGTGDLNFTVNEAKGSGTFSSWTVNLDGAVGVLGYTGSQGTQGTTGYTGSNGTNGYTGSKGDLGYTGSQGTQGNAGNTGYTGSASTVAGPTGYTGSAGSYNQSLNTTDSPAFVEVTLGGSSSNTVYPLITGDGITYTSYYLSGISGTSTQNLDTYNASTYVSAKYHIQVVDSGSIYFTELLVTQNGTNVYEVEYGQLSNNGSLGSFQAILNSGNLVLQFTPTGASNMTIRVAKILFAL